MIVEFKELEENLQRMWIKLDEINNRTKNHTKQIKELQKKYKDFEEFRK